MPMNKVPTLLVGLGGIGCKCGGSEKAEDQAYLYQW